MWFLETTSAIMNHQSGVRKNQSTTDCLAQSEIDVENAMSRKKLTITDFYVKNI